MKKLGSLLKKIEVFEKLANEASSKQNFLKRLAQEASGLETLDTSGASSAAKSLTKAVHQFFSSGVQLPANIRGAVNAIRVLAEKPQLDKADLQQLLSLAKSINYAPQFPGTSDPAGTAKQWTGLVLSNVRNLLSQVGAALSVSVDDTVSETSPIQVVQPTPSAQRPFPKALQQKLNQIVSVEGLGSPISVNGLWTQETSKALNQFKAKHAPDATGFKQTVDVLQNYHPGYDKPAVDESQLENPSLDSL